MRVGFWMFWIAVALIFGSFLGGTIAWRAGRPFLLVINIALVVINLTIASLWYAMLGECLLPQSALKEYTPGMTLCPGQATTIRVRFTLPPSAKEI